MLRDKNKLWEIACFIIAPMILAGILAHKFFPYEAVGFTIAVGLIMAGIVNRWWKKDKL